MKTEGNEPISPTMRDIKNIEQYGVHSWQFNGLTKREYFAAMAMQGIMVFGGEDTRKDANLCVQMADALINALNQKEKQDGEK